MRHPAIALALLRNNDFETGSSRDGSMHGTRPQRPAPKNRQLSAFSDVARLYHSVAAPHRHFRCSLNRY
jgi:hypothetical protein